MSELRNRTAVITGASSGIGRATAVKLAGYGMNLVLTGRRGDELEKTAAMAEAAGGKGFVCAGDLTDIRFLPQILNCAVENTGRLDVLVNNAGNGVNLPMEQVDEALFDNMMMLNVKAPYFLTQKALPYLRKSDCATVFNICSVVAHVGYAGQSIYAASKHALLGWSESLARETYKEGIRVHTISPGSVYTDMILRVRPDVDPAGMIMPEDVADVIGFLMEHRGTHSVIDDVSMHRSTKEPFSL
ncbi:MAG: SDR family oxidoreductase [Eubacterium sp.]|nr:SDR family oxidoreductase [Eubacterium sp.]